MSNKRINKKKAQQLANESKNVEPSKPVWITSDDGKIVGVKTLHGEFSIRTYSNLMMSAPGSTVMYMYNKRGDKVAWDIRNTEELNEVVNNYMR